MIINFLLRAWRSGWITTILRKSIHSILLIRHVNIRLERRMRVLSSSDDIQSLEPGLGWWIIHNFLVSGSFAVDRESHEMLAFSLSDLVLARVSRKYPEAIINPDDRRFLVIVTKIPELKPFVAFYMSAFYWQVGSIERFSLVLIFYFHIVHSPSWENENLFLNRSDLRIENPFTSTYI